MKNKTVGSGGHAGGKQGFQSQIGLGGFVKIPIFNIRAKNQLNGLGIRKKRKIAVGRITKPEHSHPVLMGIQPHADGQKDMFSLAGRDAKPPEPPAGFIQGKGVEAVHADFGGIPLIESPGAKTGHHDPSVFGNARVQIRRQQRIVPAGQVAPGNGRAKHGALVVGG